MNIDEATRRYEAWLISTTFINQKQLLRKHELMREGAFTFLRGAFYRWTQLWPEICPDLRFAPRVLAVGDLQIENFGTWRDNEGRLVWGVNDFDEAYPLPYTNDLVRLAASAMLANDEHQLALKPKDACEAILFGYMKGLDTGGRPFVLEEDHKNLRTLGFRTLRNPRRFWKKLMDEDRVKGGVPVMVGKMLEEAMPKAGLSYQFFWGASGLGSLGRFSVVAIAEWDGGKLAREVKALAPSACLWARGRESKKILYQSILRRAIRSHDPFVQVKENWLTRRLSAHCCQIEISELPKNFDEYRLLHAMGWETANIHFGSHGAADIKRDLAKREASWLRDAAKEMAKATVCDWKDWKNS